MFKHWWKRSYREDKPAETETSGGGGGGTPASDDSKPAGGEPKPEETPKPAEEEAGKELARLKEENEKLTKRWEKASQLIEHDDVTGEIKVKMPRIENLTPEKTPEEIEQEQHDRQIAEQSAQLADSARRTEETIIEKFKSSDPLFAKNFASARDKMSRLPMQNRADPSVWERAYTMAKGENAAEYEKWVRSDERNKTLDEVSKGRGATLPSGRPGETSTPSKTDISKVVLTPEQRDACASMIKHGLLKSEEEYKENLIFLGEV